MSAQAARKMAPEPVSEPKSQPKLRVQPRLFHARMLVTRVEEWCVEAETPEETARRELQEETGLTAEELELLTTAHLSNSVCDEVAYIFRASGLTHGPNNPEGAESIDVRRVPWAEAWAMLRRGEITDSISVIAILHEAVRRGQAP